MNEIEKAFALLEAARDAVIALNKILVVQQSHVLWKAGLQIRYGLSGGGHAGADLGLKPIIPILEEHRRHVAFSTDIDRDHYRALLRRQRMSEPMIWDRWPARNEDERADQAHRVAAWNAARATPETKKPAPPPADEFETFLKVEARRSAKILKMPYEVLVADADFRERQKRIFESFKTLELDL
jgi:hypothetical protein